MKRLILVAGFVFIPLNTLAQELKDPHLRNEDISNTTVSVNVTLAADGNYLYEYSITSNSDNLGTISGFAIDISCEHPELADLGHPPTENFSEDGKHVSVALESKYGEAVLPAITADNFASWSTQITPDSGISGVKMYSPRPPVDRTYEITPFMDTSGWAYDENSEDDPTIPWIDDFMITGTTQGPRCGPEDDGGDNGNGEFAGTGVEPANINALLTYDAPASDPATTNDSLTLIIHYNSGIDSSTFEAKLDGKTISDLFSPRAGKSETVVLDNLSSGLNRLRLSVMGVTTGNARGKSDSHRQDISAGNPSFEKRARLPDEQKSKDVDTFHITKSVE